RETADFCDGAEISSANGSDSRLLCRPRWVDSSSSAKVFQCCDDGLGLHALAEFDIDLPCRHQPIASDDKLGRHRQEIAAISLIFLKFHASLFVQLLDLSTDPKDEAKRERIT